MTEHHILAVNPGSTSTKAALFRNEEKLQSENIFHTSDELARFPRVCDQGGLREKVVLDFLQRNGFEPKRLSAVVGRGGMLTPLESGTYLVSEAMTKYLLDNPVEHASNLGAVLAKKIADRIGGKAFIVDPVVVDELDDVARVSGIPVIPRQSIFHALNQKAAAREAAKQLGTPYSECNLVVAHLGGGISVGAHRRGRVVDVNNALNGEGPMGPERAGTIPAWSLVELANSGRHDRDALRKMITGKGGMTAHLGTNDVREARQRMEAGDARSRLVYHAMAFQVAKEIGAMSAVLSGRIDAVVLTGGIAFDTDFLDLIRERISFIAPVIVLPGEDEMTSLALGALRVLKGEEEEKRWFPDAGN